MSDTEASIRFRFKEDYYAIIVKTIKHVFYILHTRFYWKILKKTLYNHLYVHMYFYVLYNYDLIDAKSIESMF